MKTTGTLPRAWGRSSERPVGSYRISSSTAADGFDGGCPFGTAGAPASDGPCARENAVPADERIRKEIHHRAGRRLIVASPVGGRCGVAIAIKPIVRGRRSDRERPIRGSAATTA
jgi:hypothetical protein